MKKKALVSSILTIALCLSLIAGSTFALFTSTSKVNVAVTAGKVDVVATIENVKLYSPTTIGENGNIVDETNAASETFANGGTAMLEGNKLTLTNITPGDKVTFDVEIKNNSNVTVQYRSIVEKIADNGLWAGLKVTIDDDAYNGETKKSEWAILNVGSEVITVPVTIELPTTAGNAYQEKSCELAYTVEAVQGNAEMPDEWNGGTSAVNPENNVYTINTAAELVWVMEQAQDVNSAFLGKQIVLNKDIDFGGAIIKGIGSERSNFAGNFDGKGHTISNFVINNSRELYAGLFNQITNGGSVKNLTVENATVIGNRMVGVIASSADDDCSVENCHVKNCTVVSNMKEAGAVIGYVSNGTVKDCSATDCTVICKDEDVNESNKIVGFGNAGSNIADNTATNVVVLRNIAKAITNAAEFTAYITELNNNPQISTNRYDMANVALINDIDLGGAVIEVSGEGYMFSGSFDGLGHTVSNYTVKRTDSALYTGLFSVYMQNASIKNLTVKNGTVISDGGQVGAVVASVNDGATVENCKAFNCFVSGEDQVGSVVGYVCDGVVKDCYAEDCSVLYSEGKHQTNQQFLNGNGNGNNRGEVVGFINTIAPKVDNTSNNTYRNVTVGKGAYISNGVMQDENGVYYISTAAGLNWLNDQINNQNNSFNYKTIMLSNDIDMNGANWLPMGQNFTSDTNGRYTALGYANTVEFRGTFDGNGKTISNLNINGLTAAQVAQLDDTQGKTTDQDIYSVGFFGYLQGTVKNLTFKDVTVTGYHNVGTVAGFTDVTAYIENCHVENATVTATHINDDQCGDKVGGIVGFLNNTVTNGADIKDCTVKNSTVSAGRDAGQVIGCTASGVAGADTCSATNVTVSYSGGCTDDDHGANIRDAVVGRVL